VEARELLNLRVADFAEVERSKAGVKRVIRYRVHSPHVLRDYFEACAYKPAVLAKRLGIHYQSVRVLLQQNDLWHHVKTRNGKGSGTNQRKKVLKNPHGYLYSSNHESYKVTHDKDGQARSRRQLQHIEVAERTLGRALTKDEVVHHVNLDKTDNRPENLYVTSRSEHKKTHHDLEALAGRLVEAGQISFAPELGKYVFVGGRPDIKREIGSGFVRVVDALGSDVTVVNAARVSFGKSIAEIRSQDKNLLSYLAEHGHTSPFRHVYVQFHIKAPEFVARQWYKHIVGGEYSFKDTAWNEISGRYVEYDMSASMPGELRRQSDDRKQGSSDEVVEDAQLLNEFHAYVQSGFDLYKRLIESGVAKEQARTVLPITFNTEWYWTASLQALSHFVSLRDHPNAQVEIQDYARLIDDCMLTLFPNAWRALRGAA